jgi:hypothetical protein
MNREHVRSWLEDNQRKKSASPKTPKGFFRLPQVERLVKSTVGKHHTLELLN